MLITLDFSKSIVRIERHVTNSLLFAYIINSALVAFTCDLSNYRTSFESLTINFIDPLLI
ncbi:hypothetical protein VQ7734_04184 [Vibrio quintilis]|uniref:Uncharacterized protein n=1 Tax=Vibrio quintilis TaxID=1117707 RepID=A0A1M7Z0Q7_9VIBR|nr:hypothetical protein VQ7734_04184 [Vibrio quintilis]